MTLTKLLIIGALCLVLCLVIGAAVTPALAAATGEGDKNLANRQGIKGALQTNAKNDDKKKDSKGASKLQMAVGVGSIFVMIAVVKWL